MCGARMLTDASRQHNKVSGPHRELLCAPLDGLLGDTPARCFGVEEHVDRARSRTGDARHQETRG